MDSKICVPVGNLHDGIRDGIKGTGCEMGTLFVLVGKNVVVTCKIGSFFV